MRKFLRHNVRSHLTFWSKLSQGGNFPKMWEFTRIGARSANLEWMISCSDGYKLHNKLYTSGAIGATRESWSLWDNFRCQQQWVSTLNTLITHWIALLKTTWRSIRGYIFFLRKYMKESEKVRLSRVLEGILLPHTAIPIVLQNSDGVKFGLRGTW